MATADDIGPVKTWDLHTGEVVSQMEGYARRAVHLAISPDGTEIAVRESGGNIRRWLVSTGQELSGRIDRIAWADLDEFRDQAAGLLPVRSPDGAWIAVANGRTIRILDADASELVALMRVDHDVSSCAWTPSGDALAVSGSAGLYMFVFRRPAWKVPRPREPIATHRTDDNRNSRPHSSDL